MALHHRKLAKQGRQRHAIKHYSHTSQAVITYALVVSTSIHQRAAQIKVGCGSSWQGATRMLHLSRPDGSYRFITRRWLNISVLMEGD
jgi:hypothetical protein